MDGLTTFAREFPAWMHRGWPLSWRHYVYGMAQVRRAAAKESLRFASASRAAQAGKVEAFKEWRGEVFKETI